MILLEAPACPSFNPPPGLIRAWSFAFPNGGSLKVSGEAEPRSRRALTFS